MKPQILLAVVETGAADRPRRARHKKLHDFIETDVRLDPEKACKISVPMYCSTHSILSGNGKGSRFMGADIGGFGGILRGISNHKVPALHFALLFGSWGVLPRPVFGEHLLAASSGLMYSS